MINSYTVMGLWFNVFVTIMLPIVAVTMLIFRKKISIPSVLSGGATFFLAQMVLLSPINNFLQKSGWFVKIFNNGTAVIPYLIFLALLATFVVEPIRYLSIKYTIGERFLSFSNVIGFTLGFTCLESFVLAGIANTQNLYYAFMINNGALPLLAVQLGTERSQAILSTLQAIHGDTLFMLAIERLFMAVVQMFLTTFVFMSIKFKKPVFFWVAVVANFFVTLISGVIATLFSSLGSLIFLFICTMGFVGFLVDVPKVFSGASFPTSNSQQNKNSHNKNKKFKK